MYSPPLHHSNKDNQIPRKEYTHTNNLLRHRHRTTQISPSIPNRTSNPPLRPIRLIPPKSPRSNYQKEPHRRPLISEIPQTHRLSTPKTIRCARTNRRSTSRRGTSCFGRRNPE